MIDGGLRPMFHQKFRGWHWQAIETGGTGRGIPDSNYCYRGVEGWIEMKGCEASHVGLRPEQTGWISRRVRNGGRVFIAVRQRHAGGPRKGDPIDRLWLIPGRDVETLHRQGLEWAAATSDAGPLVWHGGPARWDWDAVATCLLGPS